MKNSPSKIPLNPPSRKGEVPLFRKEGSGEISPGVWQRLSWTYSDVVAMTWRNLKRYQRVPQLLVFSTIQPVMFMLLFTYVFGGAIQTPGIDYLSFLVPGVLIQSVVFGSSNTGVGLSQDLATGMIDRFNSLPIARLAVLGGRTLADLVRNLFVVTLMTIVAYLIGFRFHGSVGEVLAALSLAALLGFAFSWISAAIGVAVKDSETAQVAGFVWLFPLVFASSIFVPVQTMPDWLKVFAEHSPITYAATAVRSLSLGTDPGNTVWYALAWITGILIVFMPLSVALYRRRT